MWHSRKLVVGCIDANFGGLDHLLVILLTGQQLVRTPRKRKRTDLEDHTKKIAELQRLSSAASPGCAASCAASCAVSHFFY